MSGTFMRMHAVPISDHMVTLMRTVPACTFRAATSYNIVQNGLSSEVGLVKSRLCAQPLQALASTLGPVSS
eukprot:jgi/Botrbrau1/8176/Bobra.357_2s0021.1